LIIHSWFQRKEVLELQHLLKLRLAEAAIKVGLLMGIVMISTTIKSALMMVEIAVDPMSIQHIAQNVSALKEEGEEVGKLQLAQSVIKVGLLMGIVMISTTIKPAPMMVEIAVDPMSIQHIAQNVSALKEEGEEQQLAQSVFKVGFLMGFVMISTTIKPAPMMVEIAVDPMLIYIIAQNVSALKEEGEEQQLAQSVFKVGFLMGFVIMSTTIKPATMMVEIAEDPGQC
jgi:hypothetical protein